MIYLQLFLSFLQIGALSFGGGYAAMPLIEAQIVTAQTNDLMVGIFALSFLLLRRTKLNAIAVMVLAGVCSLLAVSAGL